MLSETNVNRSHAFIRVFDGTETNRKQGRPTNDEVELLRGALVFSVGALDNFITELILELVPKFGGNGEAMKQPLTEISKADPSLPLRVALAGPDNAEDEFRDALGNWLETKSFHGVEKIVAALRFIGVTMDESTLPGDWKKSLNEFTERRHKIVHRGNKNELRREKAQACTDLVEEIGKSINRVAVKLYH
jgi:hypothetical protein